MKSHSVRAHLVNESAGNRFARGKWLIFAAIALITLPSTTSVNAQGLLYTVNTTSDTVVLGACQNGSPGCSLRGAIGTANAHAGADGIELDLPAGSVIFLTQALPDLTESVSITGAGANMVTVQRSSDETTPQFRIFNVTTTGPVTLSGMTISNGVVSGSALGGGVKSGNGTLNMTDCTLSGNSAGSGGGIYNDGPMNLTNCTLTINNAGFDGGGIFSGAVSPVNVNLINCTLSSNNSGSNRNGGGIYNGSAVTMHITNSTLSGNSAGSGAGIYNDGPLTVTRCTLSSNTAESKGGGIYTDGALTVNSSTLTGNAGGGIYNGSAATVTVDNSTLSDNVVNSAATFGGGIYNGSTGTVTLNSSTLSHNSTPQDGGGISNAFGGTVNVTNSTLSSNSAARGGGIFNTATVNMTNSTLSANFAPNGAGLHNFGGTATVTNCTISGNNALQGGGIENSGTANVKSSLIALNTASNASPDLQGSFTSQGFNLIGKNDGAATSFPAGNPNANKDIVGTSASPIDPKLDPAGLQTNGGPSETIALQSISPAIDKGTSNGLTGTLTVDQRGVGFLRIIDDPSVPNTTGGTGADVGAFEFGANVNTVSRKLHGATPRDINLPLSGTPGIECRIGGASFNHKVIFTFLSPVTLTSASVTSGIGSVSSHAVNGSKVTVNLTGVANAQRITITLFGLSDGSNTNNLSVTMGVLLGDTTGSGSVNSSDIGLTKSKSGQTVNASNFRTDVTVSGSINSSDIGLVKSKSGTALP